MKIRSIFKTAAALAVSASLLTACAGNGGSQTSSDDNAVRTIRVANMTGQPDQYAAFIGTQQGIFEKYNINVEATEYAYGINTVDAVVTGTADIGQMADFATANRFGNTLEATNLVIASDLSSSISGNGGVYVAPKYADAVLAGDVSTLDGSEGWVTCIGTVTEYYNWQAQTYLGLDPDKQNSLNAADSSTQLAVVHQGSASAIVATGSMAEKVEEEGWVRVANTTDVGINVSAYLITTKDFAENNTDLLADYLKAIDESTQYINDNLDESAKAISEKFGIDEDTFKSNWESYTFKFGLTETAAAHLDEINEWAFQNGKFPTEYNIRQFYFTAAAEKAFPENTDVDLSSVQQ